MTTTKQIEKMLKTTEAAKILRMTPAILRIWVQKRLIKCGKTPGGQFRFQREEVNRIKRIILGE